MIGTLVLAAAGIILAGAAVLAILAMFAGPPGDHHQ